MNQLRMELADLKDEMRRSKEAERKRAYRKKKKASMTEEEKQQMKKFEECKANVRERWLDIKRQGEDDEKFDLREEFGSERNQVRTFLAAFAVFSFFFFVLFCFVIVHAHIGLIFSYVSRVPWTAFKINWPGMIRPMSKKLF